MQKTPYFNEAIGDEPTQILLGTKGKALMLRNHGLLTVGHTVDEACYLMLLSQYRNHILQGQSLIPL